MTLKDLEKSYTLRIIAYMSENPDCTVFDIMNAIDQSHKRSVFLRVKSLMELELIRADADANISAKLLLNLTDDGKKIADAIRCIE